MKTNTLAKVFLLRHLYYEGASLEYLTALENGFPTDRATARTNGVMQNVHKIASVHKMYIFFCYSKKALEYRWRINRLAYASQCPM